jgi:hypothetical protein
VLGVALELGEVHEVARVRELVEIDDLPVRAMLAHILDEVGANEPATACNQDVHFALLWETGKRRLDYRSDLWTSR